MHVLKAALFSFAPVLPNFHVSFQRVSIGGVSHAPMALGDSPGNVVLLHTLDTTYRAEQYARIPTISMGDSAAPAMPVVRGAQAKRHLIHGTLPRVQQMGTAVLAARKAGDDPAEVVAAPGHGRVLFRGTIADLERKTVQGFARGE